MTSFYDISKQSAGFPIDTEAMIASAHPFIEVEMLVNGFLSINIKSPNGFFIHLEIFRIHSIDFISFSAMRVFSLFHQKNSSYKNICNGI